MSKWTLLEVVHLAMFTAAATLSLVRYTQSRNLKTSSKTRRRPLTKGKYKFYRDLASLTKREATALLL